MEDLFAGSIPSQLSAAPAEKEFTVSEISFEIKKFVESNFNRVRVKGEIFGGKRADSGHWYLSLKDENALLSAVIWKGVASRLTFKPEDGLEVIATGKITTFAGNHLTSWSLTAWKSPAPAPCSNCWKNANKNLPPKDCLTRHINKKSLFCPTPSASSLRPAAPSSVILFIALPIVFPAIFYFGRHRFRAKEPPKKSPRPLKE